MNRLVLVPPAVVDETLCQLRLSGRDRKEGIVLWLAKAEPTRVCVVEAVVPKHEAASDYFHIPPAGIAEVMARLRSDRLMIAAQVHSHPRQAFHSLADDTWAIVRHEGALSVVVPNFAEEVSAATFLAATKTFALDGRGRWLEVPHRKLPQLIQVSS